MPNACAHCLIGNRNKDNGTVNFVFSNRVMLYRVLPGDIQHAPPKRFSVVKTVPYVKEYRMEAFQKRDIYLC